MAPMIAPRQTRAAPKSSQDSPKMASTVLKMRIFKHVTDNIQLTTRPGGMRGSD